MDVVLLVKSKKIPLTLPEDAKVSDLQYAVARELDAPEGMQKIIHKGTTITQHPEDLLTDHGVKQGSKFMVLNRAGNEEEDKFIKRLSNIETPVDSTIVAIDDLLLELDSYVKGYHAGKKEEMRKNLKKNFVRKAEFLMKQIEIIDALSILADFVNAKRKKKTLIVKIQKYLDECDQSIEKLS